MRSNLREAIAQAANDLTPVGCLLDPEGDITDAEAIRDAREGMRRAAATLRQVLHAADSRVQAAGIAHREQYDVHINCGGEVLEGRCCLCDRRVPTGEIMRLVEADEVLVEWAARMVWR